MSGLWSNYLMPGQRLPGRVFDLAFVVLCLAVTAYAWWRRWPRWSAPWLGYALAVLFFLLETTLTGPLHSVAFLAWLTSCAVVFFWLADRDWTTACLAAFSWVPMIRGVTIAINNTRIPSTTNSSIKVKPCRFAR